MSQMSLRLKIYLGFTIVLAILAYVSFTGFQAIESSTYGFKAYMAMIEDSNRITDLSNLAKDRLRNTRTFFFNGSQEMVDLVNSISEELHSLLEDSSKNTQNEERRELFNSIRQLSDQFLGEFQRVVVAEGQTRAIKNEKYAKYEDDISSTLEEISTWATENQNLNIMLETNLAFKYLLGAKLHNFLYFDRNLQEYYDSIFSNLASLNETIERMSQLDNDPAFQARLENIRQMSKKYGDATNEFQIMVNDFSRNIMPDYRSVRNEISEKFEELQQSVQNEQETLGAELQANNNNSLTIIFIISLAALALTVFLGIILTNSISAPLKEIFNGLQTFSKRELLDSSERFRQIAAGLETTAEQVSIASNHSSSASHDLAITSSQQASSVEEINSSIEQLAAMTKENAKNSREADQRAEEAKSAMQKMNDTILEIKKSADETAKIIKIIDEIAFQTNLLALNAAVEAARAGEAGKGFAVVAEEVRNLAKRSADAAKDTSELLEYSQSAAQNGVQVSEEVNQMLENTRVLINKVSNASDEQTQGISQVAVNINEIDKITQNMAANSEETAAAGAELSTQADELKSLVESMQRIIGTSAQNGSKERRLNNTKQLEASRKSSHFIRTPDEVIPLDDNDLSEF